MCFVFMSLKRNTCLYLFAACAWPYSGFVMGTEIDITSLKLPVQMSNENNPFSVLTTNFGLFILYLCPAVRTYPFLCNLCPVMVTQVFPLQGCNLNEQDAQYVFHT